jgi:type II secretory pathway pseudopilin PulG
MSILGSAAASSLSRAVEAAHRAEEKRLTSIRTALRKAKDAHYRELDRVLCGS